MTDPGGTQRRSRPERGLDLFARHRVGFAGLLSVGTAVVVLPAAGLGVLATLVIADFGINRGLFGLMLAAASAVSALVSPLMGKVTDGMGGRRSLLGVFIFSAAGIAGVALAPRFGVALVLATLTGFGVAWASPATNRLLTNHIPIGRRGFITGVKQSGEMIAFVMCGALLPVLAVRLGWRLAFGLVGLIPVVSIVWAARLLPSDAPRLVRNRTGPTPVPPVRRDIWWLSAYSLLMGVGCGSIVAYLALFAHEAVGLSITMSGFVVLTAALTAIVFRVVWSLLTERAAAYRRSFGLMSLLAAVSVLFLWSASSSDRYLVWIGAAGFGATGLSFAALGMLAAMAASSDATTGRDTGLVNLGFSSGLTIGPPLFGLAADTTGGYTVSLLGAALAMVAASVIVLFWRVNASASF